MNPIEFAPSFRKRPIRHVLMDWDGTTSLGRAGWGELMTDIYVENLPHIAGEDTAARRAFAWEELMRLNGRPSIHQMAHLADLIGRRGGTAAHAAQYQSDFQRRLSDCVEQRLAAVQSTRRPAESLLVPGVRELFTGLIARGVGLTLVSGTPIMQLRAEAELLEVAHFFEGRIHGPADTEDRTFTKRAIFESVLSEHALDGSAFLAFGDGPVEIIETKALGGLAIAVASDETEHGSGRVDEWKRQALLDIGADAVIADFQDAHALLEAIL